MNRKLIHKRTASISAVHGPVTAEISTELKGDASEGVYSIFNDIIIENKSADMWRKYSSKKTLHYEEHAKEEKVIHIDLDRNFSIDIKIALYENEGYVEDEMVVKQYTNLLAEVHNHISKITEDNLLRLMCSSLDDPDIGHESRR